MTTTRTIDFKYAPSQVWTTICRPDDPYKTLVREDGALLYGFHASTTRVWREEQSVSHTDNGQIFGDMPHNWASVEFIRLVRHLLVFERGDSLDLLMGLPGEWIKPGATLHLEKTPTRFGPVTILLKSRDGKHVDIEIEFDASWPLKPAHCLLYLPGASRLTVNGAGATLSGDTLELSGTSHVRIEAYIKA